MKLIKPNTVGLSGSFTRGSTGTYVNNLGYLASAAINIPRLSNDPTNLTFKGLIVEEAVTNLASYSEDFSNAVWLKEGTTVTVNATSSPYGSDSIADRLLETTATGTHRLRRAFTVTAGQPYSVSFFVKKDNVNKIRLVAIDSVTYSFDFDFTTKLASNLQNLTASDYLIEEYTTTGWFRLSIRVASAVNTSISSGVWMLNSSGSDSYTGVATNGLFVFGAQFEVATKETSYIPALAATATRSADVVTGTGLLYTSATNAYAAWSSATTYSLGNRVTYNNHYYESLTNSNLNNTPNASAQWLDLGADNRTAALDDKVSTGSSATNELVILVATTSLDSIALLNLESATVEVSCVDDASNQVVYTGVAGLSGAEIYNWYDYFFISTIDERTQVIFSNVPSTYTNYLVAIRLKNSGNVSIGQIVFGLSHDIGVTSGSPKVGIVDYSKKDTDSYGNTFLAQGAYSKRLSVDVFFENTQLNRIQRLLTSIRATPVVWVASDNPTYEEALIVYGFYKDFSTTIAYVSHSLCSIEIEGLI